LRSEQRFERRSEQIGPGVAPHADDRAARSEITEHVLEERRIDHTAEKHRPR